MISVYNSNMKNMLYFNLHVVELTGIGFAQNTILSFAHEKQHKTT